MDSSPPLEDEDTTTIVFLRPSVVAPTAGRREAGRTGLWSVNDVTAFLQVSRSWVYQKVEDGRLPVIRLPGSSLLRFEPEAIKAFARGEWKPAKIPVVPTVKPRK
jgi:excisionase family DNA binding protein